MNYFQRTGNYEVLVDFMSPFAYIDVDNKTIYISKMEFPSPKLIDSHSWSIQYANVFELIPIKDRYWIVNDVNWHLEVFGEYFYKLMLSKSDISFGY